MAVSLYKDTHPPPIVLDRLMKKVQKTESCWVWVGAKVGEYGLIQLPNYGKRARAHVVSYELHHGPVPEGKEVCHSCNTKLCINPAHLYAGTHLENLQQAAKDGLIVKGEDHHKSKLSEADVLNIKKAMIGFAPKGKRAQEVAEAYGVTRSTVANIVNNLTWKGI